MAQRGRPPELTEALVQQVYEALCKTAYVETAAPLCGLSARSVYRWIARGGREQRRLDRGLPPKVSESLYLAFWQTIKKARAEVEQKSLGTIQHAASVGEWTAAAWILERLAPSRWSNMRAEIRQLRKANEEMRKQLEEIQNAIAPKP